MARTPQVPNAGYQAHVTGQQAPVSGGAPQKAPNLQWHNYSPVEAPTARKRRRIQGETVEEKVDDKSARLGLCPVFVQINENLNIKTITSPLPDKLKVVPHLTRRETVAVQQGLIERGSELKKTVENLKFMLKVAKDAYRLNEVELGNSNYLMSAHAASESILIKGHRAQSRFMLAAEATSIAHATLMASGKCGFFNQVANKLCFKNAQKMLDDIPYCNQHYLETLSMEKPREAPSLQQAPQTSAQFFAQIDHQAQQSVQFATHPSPQQPQQFAPQPSQQPQQFAPQMHQQQFAPQQATQFAPQQGPQIPATPQSDENSLRHLFDWDEQEGGDMEDGGPEPRSPDPDFVPRTPGGFPVRYTTMPRATFDSTPNPFKPTTPVGSSTAMPEEDDLSDEVDMFLVQGA